MYRRLDATTDTYITDKLISGKRKKEANTGKAGTLDIFKLYNVTNSGSTNNITELSRGLIKFDLSELRALTGSLLNYSHSSFKCYLKMFDVYHGNPTPSNFKIEIYPLSRSFSEGKGMDVAYFGDVDTSNFITASYDDSPSLWYKEGADKKGLLGSSDIDIISSGNLSDGNGVQNLFVEQTFTNGTEDLNIDVTTLVSATLANQIPDCGFRVSLSSSLESDDYTYFVKRFGTKDAADINVRPKMLVKYNDSIHNHISDFYFDLSGSIFLRSFGRSGMAKNLLSSSYQGVSGTNSITLDLVTTGSSGALVTSSFIGSQHKIGTMFMTGVYSASFALSSFDSQYSAILNKSGSVAFEPVWCSADGTIAFHTGSIFTMNKLQKQSYIDLKQRLSILAVNLQSNYKSSDNPTVRIFVEDNTKKIIASRIPLEKKSMIFTNLYYSIRDATSNDVIIPFDAEQTTRSTLLSVDEKGMYFKLYMTDFDVGRNYEIDIMLKDAAAEQVFMGIGGTFTVRS